MKYHAYCPTVGKGQKALKSRRHTRTIRRDNTSTIGGRTNTHDKVSDRQRVKMSHGFIRHVTDNGRG